MTFEVNGCNGKYDNLNIDDSVKYGRNAVENHIQYMEKPVLNVRDIPAPILNFSPKDDAIDENIEAMESFASKNDTYLNSLPPLEYEYRYMPEMGEGKVDKKAVLGAAYQEMQAKELSVEEFENRYLIDDNFTAKPLDINNDGKIDIAEYGANIIATDLLSKGTTDVSKVDGKINNKGMNAIIAYTAKANAEAAGKLYKQIYNTYQLGSALDSFKAE